MCIKEMTKSLLIIYISFCLLFFVMVKSIF